MIKGRYPSGDTPHHGGDTPPWCEIVCLNWTVARHPHGPIIVWGTCVIPQLLVWSRRDPWSTRKAWRWVISRPMMLQGRLCTDLFVSPLGHLPLSLLPLSGQMDLRDRMKQTKYSVYVKTYCCHTIIIVFLSLTRQLLSTSSGTERATKIWWKNVFQKMFFDFLKNL